MKVPIRVTSPWKASTIRSHIGARRAPRKSLRHARGAGELGKVAAGLRPWVRLEAQVDPPLNFADGGQVLFDLAYDRRSRERPLRVASVFGDIVEDALLVEIAARRVTAAVPVAFWLVKSRSKTSRGLTSLAIGVDSVRHEMFDEYARYTRCRNCPIGRSRSIPNSSEGKRVCPPP